MDRAKNHEHGDKSLEIIQTETQTKHEKQNEAGPLRSSGQYHAAEHMFAEVPGGEEKDGQK